MMLRSVIHTFVEYRRFRLFCLVLEKKYYLSRGTIKKECRDYILTNEPMEMGNVFTSARDLLSHRITQVAGITELIFDSIIDSNFWM